MFDEFIKRDKQNIIDTVCELIKFKSVSNETNDIAKPFGEECNNVLNYTLNSLLSSLHFNIFFNNALQDRSQILSAGSDFPSKSAFCILKQGLHH